MNNDKEDIELYYYYNNHYCIYIYLMNFKILANLLLHKLNILFLKFQSMFYYENLRIFNNIR